MATDGRLSQGLPGEDGHPEPLLRGIPREEPLKAGSVMYEYYDGKRNISDPRFLICLVSAPGARIEWFPSQEAHARYAECPAEVEARSERRVVYLRTVVDVRHGEEAGAGYVLLLTCHGTERRFSVADVRTAAEWSAVLERARRAVAKRRHRERTPATSRTQRVSPNRPAPPAPHSPDGRVGDISEEDEELYMEMTTPRRVDWDSTEPCQKCKDAPGSDVISSECLACAYTPMG